MSKKTVEVEVEIPEGWEAFAFRTVRDGEWFLNARGEVFYKTCAVIVHEPRFILRKTKVYRDPVLPADRFKPAKFSDDGKHWNGGQLHGWFKPNGGQLHGWHARREGDVLPWIDQDGTLWGFCQVEDSEGGAQ